MFMNWHEGDVHRTLSVIEAMISDGMEQRILVFLSEVTRGWATEQLSGSCTQTPAHL